MKILFWIEVQSKISILEYYKKLNKEQNGMWQRNTDTTNLGFPPGQRQLIFHGLGYGSNITDVFSRCHSLPFIYPQVQHWANHIQKKNCLTVKVWANRSITERWHLREILKNYPVKKSEKKNFSYQKGRLSGFEPFANWVLAQRDESLD